MNLNSFNDRLNLLKKFELRALNLAAIFLEDDDYEVKRIDTVQITRIAQMCLTIRTALEGEWYLGHSGSEIQSLVTNLDDMAFLLVAEKNLYLFIGNVLMERIDGGLSFLRSDLKFKDYRAQNFYDDWCGALEELQAWYKKKYNL